jgi:N-acetylneuraminic acid mutarotase
MKFWDRFPSLLTYRSWGPGMAAASWGLVVAGSYYSNSNSEILTERRNGWAYGPDFEIGIGSTVAVTANDHIYIVGGYQNYDYVKVRIKMKYIKFL